MYELQGDSQPIRNAAIPISNTAAQIRVGNATAASLKELGGPDRLVAKRELPWKAWLLWAALIITVRILSAVAYRLLVTTILTFFVIRYCWRYALLLSILATAFFIVVDLAFFSSSLLKIREGGWFPLSLEVVMLMLPSRQGREAALTRKARSSG